MDTSSKNQGYGQPQPKMVRNSLNNTELKRFKMAVDFEPGVVRFFWPYSRVHLSIWVPLVLELDTLRTFIMILNCTFFSTTVLGKVLSFNQTLAVGNDLVTSVVSFDIKSQRLIFLGACFSFVLLTGSN